MPRVKTFQAAFVSGEFAPTMKGRANLETYAKGAEQLRNVYVTPQGGAFGREGLAMVAQTESNNQTKIIDFEFSTEQIYLLAFSAGQMRVYRQVNGVDALQTTLTTSPISALTWDIISDIKWTQSADTLILVHPDIQPIKITRTSHTSWTAANITLSTIPDYDYGSGAEDVISATRGWPRSVAFYEGRLWFGGLKSRPQTILASKVGDFFNFDEGTGLDDEAINITIDDDRVNTIENIFPGRSLQIFTTGGEFTIAGALGDPITPSKVATQLKKATLHGSSSARVVSVDGSTIFVQRGGYVIRQFVYNDLEQSYNAPDISLISSHLIRNPLRLEVRRATENLPADYVYAVNDDGTMAVLNVLRDENLLAWSLFDTTQGDIEDVTVVGTDVYVVVNRTIGGVDNQRFIERLHPDYRLDCAIQLTSDPATDAWTGLDHLEGETVYVRGDGYVLDQEEVSSGAITSSREVELLEAGLFSPPIVKTLPAVVSLGGELSLADYSRIISVMLQLYECQEVVVSCNGYDYKPPFRSFGSGVLDAPPPEVTGWKEVFLGGYSRDSQVTITQEEPLQFGLLSVAVNLEV